MPLRGRVVSSSGHRTSGIEDTSSCSRLHDALIAALHPSDEHQGRGPSLLFQSSRRPPATRAEMACPCALGTSFIATPPPPVGEITVVFSPACCHWTRLISFP